MFADCSDSDISSENRQRISSLRGTGTPGDFHSTFVHSRRSSFICPPCFLLSAIFGLRFRLLIRNICTSVTCKIVRSHWSNPLAIRCNGRKKSQDKTLLANCGEFNRQYLTFHRLISAIGKIAIAALGDFRRLQRSASKIAQCVSGLRWLEPVSLLLRDLLIRGVITAILHHVTAVLRYNVKHQLLTKCALYCDVID